MCVSRDHDPPRRDPEPTFGLRCAARSLPLERGGSDGALHQVATRTSFRRRIIQQPPTPRSAAITIIAYSDIVGTSGGTPSSTIGGDVPPGGCVWNGFEAVIHHTPGPPFSTHSNPLGSAGAPSGGLPLGSFD